MASRSAGRTALRLAAERTVTLPTFPAVASRLIEEVARPDATSSIAASRVRTV